MSKRPVRQTAPPPPEDWTAYTRAHAATLKERIAEQRRQSRQRKA